MTLLSAPNICGNEWTYVKECLDTGWVSSVGSYVNKFEEMLAHYTGAKYSVATSSGTTALHISLLIANVKPGDYVIVPNITFIASLNSIIYTGARPILMDVDLDNWQMDLNLLEQFLHTNTFINKQGECCYKNDGKRIAAIMPVHVLGYTCNIDRLLEICKTYNLTIVEDATEALGSFYNGKHPGTFGQLGCISFNGNKIITTGGGGMILTNDEFLARRAKHLTTQAKADSFEYYHDEVGYNYRLVNVLAAIGVAQMELLPEFVEKKQSIAQRYKSALANIGDITFQVSVEKLKANDWLFTVKSNRQKELLERLNKASLQSRPFWVPMNRLPMFQNDIFYQTNDISKKLYDTCLSIPCSTQMSVQEQEQVIDEIIATFR